MPLKLGVIFTLQYLSVVNELVTGRPFFSGDKCELELTALNDFSSLHYYHAFLPPTGNGNGELSGPFKDDGEKLAS